MEVDKFISVSKTKGFAPYGEVVLNEKIKYELFWDKKDIFIKLDNRIFGKLNKTLLSSISYQDFWVKKPMVIKNNMNVKVTFPDNKLLSFNLNKGKVVSAHKNYIPNYKNIYELLDLFESEAVFIKKINYKHDSSFSSIYFDDKKFLFNDNSKILSILDPINKIQFEVLKTKNLTLDSKSFL